MGHVSPDESTTDKHAQQYDAALAKRQENARRHVAVRVAASTLFAGDVITLSTGDVLTVELIMLSRVYAHHSDGRKVWVDPLHIDFDKTQPRSTDNGSK